MIGHRWRGISRSVERLLLVLLLVVAGSGRARGACNIIPGTEKAFRSTLATADRPFARPGDWVELTLDPTCHSASPGFSTAAADQVVTVVFKPANGPRNV